VAGAGGCRSRRHRGRRGSHRGGRRSGPYWSWRRGGATFRSRVVHDMVHVMHNVVVIHVVVMPAVHVVMMYRDRRRRRRHGVRLLGRRRCRGRYDRRRLRRRRARTGA